MRSEFLQFVFCLIALVIGGACEEFLPKVSGVGIPVLLALSLASATRQSIPAMLLFALAAGAFEDALSLLPMMTSPCFFLIAALIAWRTRFSTVTLIFAYPLYEIWRTLIVPGDAESLGLRMLMAFAFAVVAAAIIPLAAILERKAAIHAA